MPIWKFKEYLTDDIPCRSPFLEWYGLVDEDVQAAADLLIHTELGELEDWDEPRRSRRKYKELTREHVGLCELMFKLGSRQFRIVGIRNLEAKEFLIFGALQKGPNGTTVPERAFEDALRMKSAYEVGRGNTRDYN